MQHIHILQRPKTKVYFYPSIPPIDLIINFFSTWVSFFSPIHLLHRRSHGLSQLVTLLHTHFQCFLFLLFTTHFSFPFSSLSHCSWFFSRSIYTSLTILKHKIITCVMSDKIGSLQLTFRSCSKGSTLMHIDSELYTLDFEDGGLLIYPG